ncbi:Sigma intracellular receptor 2-like protein [Drosera capensis]
MPPLLRLTDFILVLFFFIIAIVAPLFDAQSILPRHFYPKLLLDLSSRYAAMYGDYLVEERPHFFVGLVWMELVVLWPLSVVNLVGVLGGKGWFGRSCLVFGVSMTTSMVAILSELIGSGRASDKLLMMYFPFLGLALLAFVRGLVSSSSKIADSGKRVVFARKKRA